MADELVARVASSGCQATFSNWTSSWPSSVGTTSYYLVCPGPSPWGYQHQESRTFEYTYEAVCGQPSTYTSQVFRHFHYYCQDPESYELYIHPTNTPRIPVCYLKPDVVDPGKQPREGNCCNVGNPINVATGSKYEREVDYVGAGALPLRFERYYWGGGWTTSYSRNIFFEDVNGLQFHIALMRRDDGQELTFRYEAGVYTSENDVNRRLERVTSNGEFVGWRYTDTDDTVELYDPNGRLLSVTTRSGLVQTMNRDAGGRLLSVTDSFGRQLGFSYNASNRLVSVTDPAGGVYQFTYDGYRLASVIRPDLTTRTYLYNEPAHTGGTNLPGALTGVIDESGARYATFKYDAQGRAIQTEHADGAGRISVAYSPDGSRVVTDALGVSRTVTMQVTFGVAKLSTVTGPPCASCGFAASYSYDPNGNVQYRYDWNGTQTSFSYTSDGRDLVASRSDASNTGDSFSTTTSWHPSFRLPTQITEGNRRTDFTHDAAGNILTRTVTGTSSLETRVWTYTYDAYGRVLTEDGPRTDFSDLTTFTYYTCSAGYQCGQLHTVSDALGHLTTFHTYNAHGQPLTLTDSNGTLITLAYDALQRVTSRTVGSESTVLEYWPTGLLKKVTLPDGSFTLNTYDAAHRLIRIEDQAGNRSEYTLDAMGNRTAEQEYDVTSTLARTHTRVVNTLNQIWKEVGADGTADVTTAYGYDNNGNATSVNAPQGRNTVNQYDGRNRIKQITDPNGGLTRFTYNRFDDPLTIIDPRNKTTTYTYNEFGEVKQLVSPDTGTTAYIYDSGGNLATVTDARSKTGTYSYDALNRVTSVAYSDRTTNFTYDAGANGIGQLTGASDPNHSLAWTYDAQGRVTEKTQTLSGVAKTISYGYTGGNLTSIVTPSGQTVMYGYANGRVSGMTLNGSTTILNGVLYEPFGPAAGWTWGNSTLTARIHDQDGRVAQIDSAGLRTYSYDNASRVVFIEDDDDPSLNASYSYDPLDRLSGVSNTAPSSPTMALSGTTAAAGQSVTVTLNGAPSGGGYWLALANTVAPNTTYNSWVEVVPSSGSFVWNVVMPQFAGTYEVRLFGNGFNKIAASASINVSAPVSPPQPTLNVSASYAARGTSITVRLTNSPGGATDWLGLSLVGASNNSYIQWVYVGSGVTTRDWTVTMPNAADDYEFRLYLNNGYTIMATSPPVLLSDAAPVSGSTSQYSIQYDLNGNRLSLGSSTYTISTTNNRVLSVSGVVNRAYSYDAAGNVTGDGLRTFTYRDDGRMSSASGAASATYTYNALGQRVSKVSGGITTYFVYDEGGHLIGEYASSGALIQETLWLGDVPVATLRPNGSGGVNLYYVHTDHLNTPRRVSRPGDNVIVWRWEGDPFGATVPDADPDGDTVAFTYNLRFPGQYHDVETGLNYNYYRDYDPATGRYIESDPIGLDGGINTYAYVGDNPVAWSDPLGLAPWDWDGIGDTKACEYYDNQARATGCEYYKNAAATCRGQNRPVNALLRLGIIHAWSRGTTTQSQSGITEGIRKGLIEYDQIARSFDSPDGCGCPKGDSIDLYHGIVFEKAGLSTIWYGGNLWPQGVAPNYVPYDSHGNPRWDPRRWIFD